MSATILPLANPKGGKKLCELCQKPAYLQCENCRVTFYCDVTHQQADWNSIHKRACELLIPIRTPAPFYSLQADRDHHQAQAQKRREQLLELSRTEAQGRVSERKYEEALPAAQLSLRCAVDLYGPNTVELVPAYLLLAEANLGSGSVSKAEGYLAQAEWTVIKTPGCSRTVIQQLHRNLGRLYTASGNYNSALLNFGNDVFYASEEFGLNSIETAGGYFLMANVFMMQKKADIANSLYSQVACICHAQLSKLVEQNNQTKTHELQCFDEVQLAEVERMLSLMLEAQQRIVKTHLAPPHSLEQCMLLSHCLTMLWFLCKDHNKALDFGRKTMELSLQCEQNSLAESIQSLIQQIEEHLSTQQTLVITK